MSLAPRNHPPTLGIIVPQPWGLPPNPEDLQGLGVPSLLGVIENQLKKMFKFVFYMIVWKTKLPGVGFLRLNSGREPNLLGSESDMYTVQLGVRFVYACHLVLLLDMFLIFNFRLIYYCLNTFFNKENAANQENNTTNHKNPPPPFPSAHYSRVMYIVLHVLDVFVQGQLQDFS